MHNLKFQNILPNTWSICVRSIYQYLYLGLCLCVCVREYLSGAGIRDVYFNPHICMLVYKRRVRKQTVPHRYQRSKILFTPLLNESCSLNFTGMSKRDSRSSYSTRQWRIPYNSNPCTMKTITEWVLGCSIICIFLPLHLDFLLKIKMKKKAKKQAKKQFFSVLRML